MRLGIPLRWAEEGYGFTEWQYHAGFLSMENCSIILGEFALATSEGRNS